MTTKALIICAENHLCRLAGTAADRILFEAVIWMEVEHEHTQPFLKNGNLVVVILCPDVPKGGVENIIVYINADHSFVKGIQLPILEQLVIEKIPPAPTVVIAPVVALPGEVYPLRVAKLIAHEVQIRITTQTERYQPDHLVQGHPPEHRRRLLTQHRHICVDLRIEQPHSKCFVSHQRLIMTLSIADARLFPTVVG
jgi:hypothetical protein